MTKTYRIGQIVPSSNTTMETEVPAMLLAHQIARPEDRFTFHSSRMRMKHVVKEELAAMDAESDRCALELSDARVDVLGYACLVAIMAMGHGYHRVSQKRLTERTASNGLVVAQDNAMVELLCETDFVAKSEDFQALAGTIVATAAALQDGDAMLAHGTVSPFGAAGARPDAASTSSSQPVRSSGTERASCS